ncbi:MAG: TlpA family protein disulfide reductase, partial [Thiotrichaceae bacterium]|nr:TlpA family protein disulfide reductase [Thiotrichaceae bacterium]
MKMKNTMKKILLLLLLSVYSLSLYAVDMSMTDLKGKESKISDYLGKWVVVNYWATWCPPCRE